MSTPKVKTLTTLKKEYEDVVKKFMNKEVDAPRYPGQFTVNTVKLHLSAQSNEISGMDYGEIKRLGYCISLGNSETHNSVPYQECVIVKPNTFDLGLDDYKATFNVDNTISVGCQTIKVDKIREMLDTYEDWYNV